jgi:hypothetical protein
VARVDDLYPPHLRDTLKDKAPAVLSGAGDIRLLQQPGGAVVGSRNIDEAGAAEALRADWCPVLVRDGEGVPRGNQELLKLGARSLTASQLEEIPNLAEWVHENTAAEVSEPELFDFVLRDKPL